MAARDNGRRDVIAGAATRVIEALAADEAFVALVAETEVQRRVAAGLLVPTEALTIAGGLELVPVGVVAELRTALGELASHPKVSKIRELESLLELCRALANPTAGLRPAPLPEPEPEAPVVAPKAQPRVEGEDRRRRPRNMPDLPQQCKVCGDEIDYEQLLASWTRHRAPVCREHMAGYRAA